MDPKKRRHLCKSFANNARKQWRFPELNSSPFRWICSRVCSARLLLTSWCWFSWNKFVCTLRFTFPTLQLEKFNRTMMEGKVYGTSVLMASARRRGKRRSFPWCGVDLVVKRCLCVIKLYRFCALKIERTRVETKHWIEWNVFIAFSTLSSPPTDDFDIKWH